MRQNRQGGHKAIGCFFFRIGLPDWVMGTKRNNSQKLKASFKVLNNFQIHSMRNVRK